MSTVVDELIGRYKPISDQIGAEDMSMILHELLGVLERDIPGDIVEFGCYIGTTSLFIRRLLDRFADRRTRTFHVYDSFAGLPEKGREDDSAAGTGFEAGALAVTKKQFIHEFQKAHLMLPVIHKAWFGELTAADVPPEIAFAFIDGDFYDSIKHSLHLVLPRMQPGGLIIVDDYAHEALPGVARATEELIGTTRVETGRVSHDMLILKA